MRNKILIFLALILSFSCILKVSAAKTCYYEAVDGYYKDNGWSGDLEKCISDGKRCSHTSGNYKDMKAKFTVPSTTNANVRPKIYIEFNAWKNRFDSSEVSVNTTSDVDNWTQEVENTYTTGFEYVYGDGKNQTCPSNLLVRTGVYNSLNQHTATSYIAKDSDEAKDILNWVLSNNKHGNQSFFFVATKTSESEDQEDEIVKYTSCNDFNGDESSCTSNDYFSCLWVEKNIKGKTVTYCNFDDLTYVKCGDIWDIPSQVPGIISLLVNLLKIVTPIILIVVSIITLLKAVASSSEDAIKKAQSGLIKRLIAAAIVFFIIQITQFVILKVADNEVKNNGGKSESEHFSTCLSCFLNNDCSEDIYYKTKVGTQYRCTFLNNTSNHDQTCN